MSLFSGTPRPEEVFTPRSSDVNRRSYVPRPELEEELTEGLTESQHLIIFGESGNGKSWLYKKVFETERVSYQVINLVQASRLGSLGAAFEDRLSRREELEKVEYELAKSGGVKPQGVGFDFEGTWTYVKGKKEPFEQLLAYLRKTAGKGKAVIVLDNFEQISSDEEICKQVSNCIVLLDDPTYSEYEVKIVIVGTPAGIDEILSKSGNLQTISTRLKEIPEVERMTPNEAKSLMRLGLESALKLKVIGDSKRSPKKGWQDRPRCFRKSHDEMGKEFYSLHLRHVGGSSELS
jgi:archaellum biogenesis ATPase FlaH